MNKRTTYSVILLVLIGLVAVSPAAATTLPYGVQNDVALSTVTGAWGWTQIYRGDYSVSTVSLTDMFGGHGDLIMIGGIMDGSSTIDVLAATTWDEFVTYTARNVTHASNGAEWYYNGGSLGFAGLGDTISQSSADTNGLNERDRLSWHTNGGYGSVPTEIQYGWRSGDNYGLNSSTNWDKIVFTANAAPVPEPATMLLLGTGLVGLAGMRRRGKSS